MNFHQYLAQGQDTIQRIVSQPRPTTASGDRKFDDLFGSIYFLSTFQFLLFAI
jgi:hypothetical protein